jgi:hypothetical protein
MKGPAPSDASLGCKVVTMASDTRGILFIEFLNASSFLLLDSGLKGMLQLRAERSCELLNDMLKGLRSVESTTLRSCILDFARC